MSKNKLYKLILNLSLIFFLLLFFKILVLLEKLTTTDLDIARIITLFLLSIFIIFKVCKNDLIIYSNKKYLYIFLLIFIIVLFGCTTAYIWYKSSVNNILYEIEPNMKFIADGQVDLWAYILYRDGIFSIPYLSIPISQVGIVYFYAFIFSIIDDFNNYYLVILNSLLKTLTGIFVFKIGQRFMNSKASMMASLFICLLPEGLLWAGMIHKDNIVMFLLMGIFLLYYKIFIDKNCKYKYFGLFIIMLFILAFIRIGFFIPVILLGIIFSVLTKSKKLNFKFIILIIFIIFVLIIPMNINQDIIHKIYIVLETASGIKTPEEILSYTNSEETSIVKSISEHKLSIIKFFLIWFHMLMYYISPFPPFVVREKIDYWLIPSTWLIIFLIPFALIGFFKFFKKCNLNQNFIVLGFLFINLTIVLSGPWILERYRLVSMPFFSLMAFFAWNRVKNIERFLILSLMPGVIIILWIVYLLIKNL